MRNTQGHTEDNRRENLGELGDLEVDSDSGLSSYSDESNRAGLDSALVMQHIVTLSKSLGALEAKLQAQTNANFDLQQKVEYQNHKIIDLEKTNKHLTQELTQAKDEITRSEARLEKVIETRQLVMNEGLIRQREQIKELTETAHKTLINQREQKDRIADLETKTTDLSESNENILAQQGLFNESYRKLKETLDNHSHGYRPGSGAWHSTTQSMLNPPMTTAAKLVGKWRECRGNNSL